jgi:hypothetical protein
MLFEELHPARQLRSGVEIYKREHESAKKHVRFGKQTLAILRARPQ